MRVPLSRCAWMFGLATLLTLHAMPARADWPTQGATIKSTTAWIGAIESCSDGANGTFVVWQETPGQGQPGILRAQHMLFTGDIDPLWNPEGKIVCGEVTERKIVSTLPDELGGLYVLWTEGPLVFLSRVAASGEIASGWVERGSQIGVAGSELVPESHGEDGQVAALSDGDHGVFVAWAGDFGGIDTSVPALLRIGPDGTQVGWSGGPRYVRPPDPSVLTREMWLKMVPAPDGGVYLAWVTFHANVPQSFTHLVRLTYEGLPEAGWPPGGYDLDPYNPTWVNDDYNGGFIPLRAVDVAEDGGGGVFLLASIPTGNGSPSIVPIQTKLRRMSSDGVPAPGWTIQGRVIPAASLYAPYLQIYEGVAASPMLVADESNDFDGVIIGRQFIYTDSSPYMYFHRYTDAGFSGSNSCGVVYWSTGRRVLPNRRGGLYVALSKTDRQYQQYELPAFLSVQQSYSPSGWAGFYESHSYPPEPCFTWFPAMSFTTETDGGAVLFWSQVCGRVGLFARRFAPNGQIVTGVGDTGDRTLGFHSARFVSGAGLRAWVTVPTGSASLQFFDATGRRVSSMTVESASGPMEVTAPGTGTLRSGIYFGRLSGAGAVATTRAAVIR